MVVLNFYLSWDSKKLCDKFKFYPMGLLFLVFTLRNLFFEHEGKYCAIFTFFYTIFIFNVSLTFYPFFIRQHEKYIYDFKFSHVKDNFKIILLKLKIHPIIICSIINSGVP